MNITYTIISSKARLNSGVAWILQCLNLHTNANSLLLRLERKVLALKPNILHECKMPSAYWTPVSQLIDSRNRVAQIHLTPKTSSTSVHNITVSTRYHLWTFPISLISHLLRRRPSQYRKSLRD